MNYHEIHQRILNAERTLFNAENLLIFDTIFEIGESPLKHSKNIELYGCTFRGNFPLWYSKDIKIQDCLVMESVQDGIWYANNVELADTLYEAPRSLRRCDGVLLKNMSFPNAEETLWSSRNICIQRASAKGDYFAMHSQNLEINHFTIAGNYAFEGVKNAEIKNAKILSKNAFWNTENVTVYDSYLTGACLGWNSENLTFINCVIESTQALCYVDNLFMRDCKLLNTTLAFEFSQLDVDIASDIESVKNPSGGIIRAEQIHNLILEQHRVDPEATKIICRSGE